jgi:Homoserine acetyltransferase
VHVGLRRLAVAFSLNGFTYEFWRNGVYRDLGFASADDVRQGFVCGYFAPMDPNNLLCQGAKWRAGDIGAHAGGDVAAALSGIRAKLFVAPFSGDMFFPVEDCAADAALVPNGQLRTIDTPFGHFAMFCLREADTAAIDAVIAETLAA